MKLYAKATWSKRQIEDRMKKGADGIEIQLVGEYDEFYNDNFLKEVDVSKIVGVHMPLNSASMYFIEDKDGFSIFEKTCDKVNALASFLDRELYLVAHFEGPIEKLKKLGMYERLVYEVKQIAKKYQNITICVENCVDNPFYKHSNVEFVRNINEPNVKTCLNTCHALISEKISFDAGSVWLVEDTSLDEFFKENKDCCGLIHLCNAVYPDDFKNYGTGQGHGAVFEEDSFNLRRITFFYKKYGYDCDIVLEIREDNYLDAQNYLKTRKQVEAEFDKTTIKDLNVSDLKECLMLFNEVYHNYTLENYPELQEKFNSEIDLGQQIADTAEALEYGKMFGKTAWQNNELVGFVLVTAPNYIRKLAVKETCRNKGVARKLIDSIGEKEIVVHAAEKVIPFYEKLGFVKDGEPNRDKYPYLPMKRIKKYDGHERK